MNAAQTKIIVLNCYNITIFSMFVTTTLNSMELKVL